MVQGADSTDRIPRVAEGRQCGEGPKAVGASGQAGARNRLQSGGFVVLAGVSDMDGIKVLREAFTNHLRTTISHNLLRYKRDKPWLAEVTADSAREVETNLEPLQSP